MPDYSFVIRFPTLGTTLINPIQGIQAIYDFKLIAFAQFSTLCVNQRVNIILSQAVSLN